MNRPGPARWLRLVIVTLFCFLTTTACLPETQAVVPSTTTPTETTSPTPTKTIIWFPATDTPTPLPTHQLEPTQEMHPALGAVLFSDDFRPTSPWSTGRTTAGSVAFGRNELTLAISEERGSLQSLRSEPQLSDFYLEIDAVPSLCRGSDSYGLLLRANTQQDYYRLALNCQGQVRLERVKDARVLPLQDWQPSGQLPQGAMMRVRLSVWAMGSDMRFFINDIYQFSARDPVWKSGQVGVFARAAGDTPLTVSFSNLQVQTIDADRIPTPAPTSTPYLSPTATRRATATTQP